MREIQTELARWLSNHEPVALAVVTQTWGSSPRAIGAKMAFTQDGKIAGSVSGGCVEGAVFETGVEVLKTGHPQFLHFGVADETAWTVGLACGGQIDVFVKQIEEPFYTKIQNAMTAGQSFCTATITKGPAALLGREMLVTRNPRNPSPFIDGIDEAINGLALKSLAEDHPQTVHLQVAGQDEIEVFIDIYDPQPTLVVVGGVHIAIGLTKIARTLGFRTIVIDPRRAFGNAERFPEVDRLIQSWPDEAFGQLTINENTAIAILTHDPKIDDPALLISLNCPAFYVGALGSPSTQEKRHQRLLEAGLKIEQLARLHGPIGLKIGGRTPEEIALAIMAEIVAVQRKELN
jgi:xanthine dehydrogenase accessory factor